MELRRDASQELRNPRGERWNCRARADCTSRAVGWLLRRIETLSGELGPVSWRGLAGGGRAATLSRSSSIEIAETGRYEP